MKKNLTISFEEEPNNAIRLQNIFRTSLLDLGWDPRRVRSVMNELEQKAIAMRAQK